MKYNVETKVCQNCKNNFPIEQEDFLFYEKMKVPPPTFCPECRFVRRLIWKNERTLYKRSCSLCDKNIISMYDDKVTFPVYCFNCYKSDNWGGDLYAKDYDFNKTFFEQWKELFFVTPRQALWQFGDCVDSEYSNFVYFAKNTYLSCSVLKGSEYVYFSNNIDNSKSIIDSYNIKDSELIYESIGTSKSYFCRYSYWSSSCINCNFILNCNNCQNCFGCVNLVNKSYCIFNIEYSKEQYEGKMKELGIGSFSFVNNFKKDFWKFSLQFPRKYANIVNSISSIGDELRDCKNVKIGFNIYGAENVKYGYRSVRNKDSMDICHSYAEQAYEHAFAGAENSQKIKFVITGEVALNNVEYVDACKSSSDLFGCIGLKSKQYCILNKQYTKEEYFEMVEKIKKQMDDMPYVDSKNRVYKYGEFFPYELCPFGYNEAVINDHFPLSKEEIIKRGYMYKEKNDNKYTITLKAKDIPDNIKDTDDSILNEVIECEVSKRAFKITQFELEFYRRMNIPIPHLHPDERYKERLLLRNPMKLWHRTCMKEGCTNEFETSYSPDRPEIIYCEECYKREIY
jgi:hypothetical protein